MNLNTEPTNHSPSPSRRTLLQCLVGLGIGTPAFQRALAIQAEDAHQVTAETVKEAEWIAGITLTDEQRESAQRSLKRLHSQCDAIRSVDLAYDTPPALHFNPQPLKDAARSAPKNRIAVPAEQHVGQIPDDEEDIAFLPLGELSSLVKNRKISSVELTKLFLKRLRRFDSLLHCVVTYTDDVAMRQAKQADRELAQGIYRGPLHGIPWGAKDLIAYPGYPTTWGAKPFVDQIIDQKATVAERLESVGAVLVAKLSLGALAMGDRWQGGMTRNPWNPKEGSSGSSAGPASAVCAGLVPFSLGSETLGSIVSPCRRCSITGLRPTFGRVSRHGCMPLAWSMDKIGPITRSVDACALVFDAIHGGDRRDPTAVTHPFQWPASDTLPGLRVGMFEKDVNGPIGDAVRALGVHVKTIRLPDDLPIWPLTTILHVEAATSFDQLTRSGVTEGLNRWPGIFHQAHFTSAVDYVRANRIRTLWMARMEEVFQDVDLYVQGDDLAITNLTGHPSVVIPFGRRGKIEDEQPSTLVFTGRLYGETELLAFSHAFQRQFEYDKQRPPLERWFVEAQKEKDSTGGA
ncbi:MAG: amidase [Pirellulaceae bacterium]